MSNNKQCQFEASRQTSSATICKWCGREKWQHNTTMSNKQSSIEWLYKELLNSEPNILEWNKLLEQAKEMHKQEIIEAYRFGLSDEYVIGSKKYYNETFGE